MKTVQYTKEREQFAQPISNFQVLQHRMVDMFIETELTKSLLIKATLQLDSDDPETANTISALKVQVGKAGRLVGQHAVQLHGGMGVSNEMSIGHYLKRFTAIDSMFGNTQHHINKYQAK
jgi:alkylation response protein AidB-like acyl-CoA dehydrogenase